MLGRCHVGHAGPEATLRKGGMQERAFQAEKVSAEALSWGRAA